MSTPTTPGADDAWEGERVERWLRQAEGLERQLAPVSDVLFAAAALAPGERVLDVGCGSGPTTVEAARRVGPAGAVVGLDVAEEMIAAASSRPVAPDSAPIDWVAHDVVDWDRSGVEAVDVVLSRFGVMFFSDPLAAFTTLRAAARDGGRLVVAVWAPRDRSEIFEVPLRVATGALRARGHDVPEPPVDGGPFSLGDPHRVDALLVAAGWREVTSTAHPMEMDFGGGLDARAAAEASLDFGPTRVVTGDLGPEDRAAVLDAVTAALAERERAGTVVLGAEPVVVTARA